MDENTQVFVISIAAELAGMHPQTLRQYDRLGLVSPGRTAGKSRRYSMRDVQKLQEIARLGSEGEVVCMRAGTRVRRSNQIVVWRPLER